MANWKMAGVKVTMLVVMFLLLLVRPVRLWVECPRPEEVDDPKVLREVCNHNGGSWYRRVEEDNLTTNISYSTNHTDFLPLVINIYLNGESIRQVICEDYTASGIVEIFFSRNCNATKVIVHMTTTAAVHLAVQLGTGNIVFCDMLNIGPQRPTFDEQHPSGPPILQIWNDSCTRSAPSVPIRVSACTNASIVLYPDGRNEIFGDISLLRLPCNDDNILKYEVIVNSNMVCAFKVKIINGTQPEICFLRTVSGDPSNATMVDPTVNTTSPTGPIDPTLELGAIAGIVASVLLVIIVLFVAAPLGIWCWKKRHTPSKKSHRKGQHDSHADKKDDNAVSTALQFDGSYNNGSSPPQKPVPSSAKVKPDESVVPNAPFVRQNPFSGTNRLNGDTERPSPTDTGADIEHENMKQMAHTNEEREQIAEGQQEENAEGQQEENAEGQQEENAEGQQEENPEGQQEENAEGQQEENAEGQQEENAEGQQEENAEGQQEENAEGQQEENAEGQQEENAEGQQEENAEGQQEENAEGQQEENAEGQQEENAEGQQQEENAEGQQEENAEGQNDDGNNDISAENAKEGIEMKKIAVSAEETS